MNSVKTKEQVVRGDIWWIRLSTTEGSVFNGTRPCIILSNDVNNAHSTVFNVVPCSGKMDNITYHVPLYVTKQKKRCMVCPEQIISVSKDQFLDYIEHVTDMDLAAIQAAVMAQLGCEGLAINKQRDKFYKSWSKKDRETYLKDWETMDLEDVKAKWHINDSETALTYHQRFTFRNERR